jgi:hypothetical protein
VTGAARVWFWPLIAAAAITLLQLAALATVARALLGRKKAARPFRRRVFERSMAWATLPALILLAAAGVLFMRGSHRVNVLRAKKELPAFKPLEAGDVEESRSPSPPAGALRSKEDALGSVTTSAIPRDALLTETMLLKERPAEGHGWFLLTVPSSTSPPKTGSRVILLGLKAGAEKPATLGEDCLVVGSAGEKVVVALTQTVMSEAAAFMQPNSSLLAVTRLARPPSPPAPRPCS